MKRLLNTNQLAEKKNVSPRTIRTWVQTGKIPVLRLGWRSNYFEEEAVDRALSKFEIKAVSAK